MLYPYIISTLLKYDYQIDPKASYNVIKFFFKGLRYSTPIMPPSKDNYSPDSVIMLLRDMYYEILIAAIIIASSLDAIDIISELLILNGGRITWRALFFKIFSIKRRIISSKRKRNIDHFWNAILCSTERASDSIISLYSMRPLRAPYVRNEYSSRISLIE